MSKFLTVLFLAFCLGAVAKTPPPTFIKDVGVNYTYSNYGSQRIHGFELFFDRFEQNMWTYKRYQSFGIESQFHGGDFQNIGARYAVSPFRPAHIGVNATIFPLVFIKASWYNNAGVIGLNLKPEFGMLFHYGQESLINFKCQITYGYDMGRRFYAYSFAESLGTDHDFFGHNSLNFRVGVALNISKLNDIDLGKEMDASPRFND